MTAALPQRARRQRELAALLSSRPLTTAEAAAELGISADDAGHVLRRLRTHGFEVVRIDPFEHEPRWRVLYPKGRVCAAEGCGTVLRRTNPSECCERHGGGFLQADPAPAWRQEAVSAVRVSREEARRDLGGVTRVAPDLEDSRVEDSTPVPDLAGGAGAPPGPRTTGTRRRHDLTTTEPRPTSLRPPAFSDGAAVRVERERRGLRLRTLATLAGLSPAYLSRIERGQRGLSAEVADRLEAALAQAPSPTAIDGAAIRAMREARGLTVRQFAELVGLSPGFVSRLECGRRPVTAAVERLLDGAQGTRSTA